MVKFLNFICDASASHIPVLFIVFELLLCVHRLLIMELFITLRILLNLAARLEAANSSDTVNGDLIKFVFGVLSLDCVSCLSSNRLTWDYTELVASVRSCSGLSDATNIAGGLSAGLPSRLGWPLSTSTCQLLLPNNVADTDRGRGVHHIFDIGRDRILSVVVIASFLLALAHIYVILVRLRANSGPTSLVIEDLYWGAWVVLTVLLLNYDDRGWILLT